MPLPLRELSDRQIAQLYTAAQASLSGFVKATKQHGSLIQSWVRGAEVTALDHYPKGDVIDRRHGAQLFYHCHREGDTEHGHVHVFCHATRSGRRRYISQQIPQQSAHSRTAPSHLLAIGLDARGLPISLFTVNRWVTGGYWFDAQTTLRLLQRFKIQGVKNHARSCEWVSGFVRMYEPLIEKLLHKRDQRLTRAGPLEKALDNQRIEILSSINLDWAADLTRLERETRRRGLE